MQQSKQSSPTHITIQGIRIRLTQPSDIIVPEGGWSFEKFDKAAKKAGKLKIFDD